MELGKGKEGREGVARERKEQEGEGKKVISGLSAVRLVTWQQNICGPSTRRTPRTLWLLKEEEDSPRSHRISYSFFFSYFPCLSSFASILCARKVQSPFFRAKSDLGHCGRGKLPSPSPE
ncbi:hypothetical protein CEXT_667401 [Caerostris extrusa]|uniref:Uncharacterized protein n=1 Tax=Caerostris extrusa TaxID=172846 RepID=A0AAV4UWC6_CAEEX|nr:hypothetical protein CEXT_667401 [Caerostris extrusa]